MNTNTALDIFSHKDVTLNDMGLNECNLVIVLVHAPAGIPGLGPTRPLGHDDLVHPQHGGGGVGGVLHGPLLGNHQIQNVVLCTILKIVNQF